MSRFRSEFLRVLDERGFIHQVSEPDRLDALAADGGLTAYIGFDATAPSLHVGHMLSIMLLRWLQRTGGKPIALMGGGTTKVGDPSFRDEARPLLDDAAISANLAGIRRVFDRFLDFGDGGAVMVNNDEWLSQLNYIEFLRDYGRHFSVNRMLSFESVKLRLDRDQSLSFLEFNYMILQAYDFVELHRRYGCRLQMGGSDQWGNIINGVDLGRRTEGADLFALTTPLLTTASGAKMGKSASGAVWLNPEMLSAYDFWQFWRNTEDADVGRFLRLFTDLPLEEVSKIERLGGAEINEAKKVLATEVTAVVHGQAAAEAAAETARRTFEEGGAGDALPRVDLPRSELETGVPVATLFVRAGLASSNGEVRRGVANNGIRVNDEALTDPQRKIGLQDLNADGVIKLSVGRKKHALVHPA